MGETGQADRLPDAAGGRAAGGLVARRALKAFWRDERGATAVELGIIVALISIVLIGALNMLSGALKTAFTKAGTAVGT
jgi:pilus assembly protein Flp/PilA